MPRKTLVCLANSKKGNGYCFAGFDLDNDGWVRPVGSGWDGAVMAGEQTLKDGTRPAVLDLVEVPLGQRAPGPGQPENWNMKAGAWSRKGHLSPNRARKLLDSLVTSELLFGTKGNSLTPGEMAGLTGSLEVLHPDEVTWEWTSWKKLYAVFNHCGEEIRLKVGDPAWCECFRNDAPNSYTIAGSSPYLIASVTVHEFHGVHWKLVAGVVDC